MRAIGRWRATLSRSAAFGRCECRCTEHQGRVRHDSYMGAPPFAVLMRLVHTGRLKAIHIRKTYLNLVCLL